MKLFILLILFVSISFQKLIPIQETFSSSSSSPFTFNLKSKSKVIIISKQEIQFKVLKIHNLDFKEMVNLKQ